MYEIWKAAGAAAWGAVHFSGLMPYLTESATQSILTLCPNAAGVFVAAFPYYAGTAPGNLSLYCRGEDYHRVLLRRLTCVCNYLSNNYPSYTFLPGSDNSPVPELAAARLAEIGYMGRHGLLIVPPYGSYVFLGTILTDLPLKSATTPSPSCTGCGACIKACPTGALSEHGYDRTRCLSHITQKKGELTKTEEDWLRKSPTIWGCDLCQRACPLNRKAQLTPLPEFRENLCPDLTAKMLEGLSNRTFRKTFGTRAFAWRGISPLRRNLELKKPE